MTYADSLHGSRLLEVPADPRACPDMRDLLHAFVWPSEAFWRHFEIDALRDQSLAAPVLELGCGDGGFSELAGLYLDQAIDVNPRAVARAQRRTAVYGYVQCCDMREMVGQIKAPVRTIFANSVLEHVPAVSEALRACAEVLEPGGQLVTTVPLITMNEHLLFKAHWYAKFRRRQLQHHNLWSLAEWREALQTAGFCDVAHVGYLSPQQCRTWDALDIVGALGFGRYRVSSALRRLIWPRVPTILRAAITRSLADRLSARASISQTTTAKSCAALLIAVTPSAAAGSNRAPLR